MPTVPSLFSDNEIERARDYHRPLYVAWAIGLTMELVILAALAFSDLGDVLFDPGAAVATTAPADLGHLRG